MTNEPTLTDALIRSIAAIIDHPSVYMGGPSRNSMRIAANIVEHHRADLAPADDKDVIIARLREEVGAAWDKCEERRLAQVRAEAKLAEVTAELEAIKGRKVAAIINGDGPMTVQKSTIRKLVEERDTARSAGTFAQGIEAAARVLEERGSDGWAEHVMAEYAAVCCEAIRALSPTPQADPVREAAKQHAVALEQCALFAGDAGEHIAKSMTEAATFLRALAQKEPSHDH